MVLLNKQITLTGTSVIKDGDNEVRIAYMNATIPAEGNPSIGHVIQDKEAFKNNKSEVLKDFAAFDEYAYDLAENNDAVSE